MTTRRMGTLTLSLLIAGVLFVATATITALVIGLGSREMSWGERIARNEDYVYVNDVTLTNDDLAYIAGLRRLTSLTLTNCNVAECRLRELTFASKKLRSVNLSGTHGLWDLSFLQTLPAQDLVLSECPDVHDLSMLNVSVLESLEIDGTDVADLTPLASSQVTRLSFAHTSVSDLTPLESLHDLWWVDGSYSQVDSIDALADFDSLWIVRFDGCPIGDVTARFTSRYLNELSLSHIQATDLSGFAGCMGIEELHLGGNTELSDLSWLDKRCHETLTKLDVGRTACDAGDLDWIASCASLKELTLDGIELGNLDLCRRLPKLELLSAVGCGLTDIEGIAGHTKLRTILLGYNLLTDMDDLPVPEDAEFGMVLDVSHNQLTSARDLPAVTYRGLLLQGNEAGIGRTIPGGLEVYDIVVDWCEGMEDSPWAEGYHFSAIYLLGCPEDQRKAIDRAFGGWLVTHVSEEELLGLLENDDLSYSLWVDLGGYVEIARAKLSE